MSIYKDLLFLDGFRVPAEYVEDVDNTRLSPTGQSPAAPRPPRRATTPPRWRRALRSVATAAGVAAPGSPGRCG